MPDLTINGRGVDLDATDPNQTLLQGLRDSLGLTGTKEGCASGDCGACTVLVLRRRNGSSNAVEVGTVNACIAPMQAFRGTAVTTVDGLASGDRLHPAQQAMIDHHASQCGFCTPGFVMSLAAHQLRYGAGSNEAAPERCARHNADPASRSALARAISGNLCRCTGYRPILDAAARLMTQPVDADAFEAPPEPSGEAAASAGAVISYRQPRSEVELQACLQAAARDDGRPPTLVAGATDLWLEVTQRGRRFDRVLDLSAVEELRRIEVDDGVLSLGAAVTHSELVDLFGAGGPEPCPAIEAMLDRFASPQIRGRGTLGGNLANGSPIADWPPLLLVLEAELEIANGTDPPRRVPMAGFYRGYRQTALAPGDYLRRVLLPRPATWQAIHASKISKRFEDDISTVFGAFLIELDEDRRIRDARIAYGGVAATPVRLDAPAELLRGQPVDGLDVDPVHRAITDALTPISDVRGSADYRHAMALASFDKALHAARSGETRRLEAVALS